MARFVIVAGPGIGTGWVEWDSDTHGVSGDDIIVEAALGTEWVSVYPEQAPRKVKWDNKLTATIALLNAAQTIYGLPVEMYEFPDDPDQCGGMAPPIVVRPA
jgi:hypothetical protein